jgi:hypothetical protein
VVDRRHLDATLPQAVVCRRQRVGDRHLEGDVVAAEASVVSVVTVTVTAGGLQRQVVVVVADGENGVPADLLPLVDPEHRLVERHRPLQVAYLRVDVSQTWAVRVGLHPPRSRRRSKTAAVAAGLAVAVTVVVAAGQPSPLASPSSSSPGRCP